MMRLKGWKKAVTNCGLAHFDRVDPFIFGILRFFSKNLRFLLLEI